MHKSPTNIKWILIIFNEQLSSSVFLGSYSPLRSYVRLALLSEASCPNDNRCMAAAAVMDYDPRICGCD